MDLVITYVNGLDPAWQADYASLTGQIPLEKRYRDWGFLPYLLRGIDRYMPFVEHVFLVVSRKSQVPIWVNQNQVTIVLHKDIIPEHFLPTFNSGTIEMFLHRIPNLSQRFLYFNDDIFPVAPLQEEMFFVGDKVSTHIARHYWAFNAYKKRVRSMDRLAQQALGNMPNTNKICQSFVRPQHTCTPMLKMENEEAFSACKETLMTRITPLRSAQNPNQYFFTDYLYYKGKVINRRISTQHCSMAVYSADAIAKHILYPKKSLLCINDVSMSPEKQHIMQCKLLAAFDTHFPNPSRFEK